MATEPSQRSYRAPCPGCGAPVNFASAQSTHAVCGYCQSTVVRNGDTLQRIGKMAEVFDDHSLLQLQASGTYNSQTFTLGGRLQYKYGEGTWTEWYALLADGSSAYLSEDNGAYVFTTATPTQRAMPAADKFRVGATTSINGKTFSVASNQSVCLIAAQGELPRLPELGASFAMVELRSAEGEVLSVDYSVEPPAVSLGRAVQLDDLRLSGLRDESAKDEQARQFSCPNCGAALTVQLASSKSMTCASCNSLIDLSEGVGGELKHALQDEPVQPLIALGSVGTLQGAPWQVVGFQHRMGYEPADPEEHFGWDEYLLYNAKRGFVFLVDSSEGWSVVKPATGAPQLVGSDASYLGKRYAFKESYSATTTYALGEFYWQVSRGQTTQNSDFASGNDVLSLEQTATEQVWSVGSKISSDLVIQAFKLESQKDLLQRSDVGPVSFDSSMSFRTLIIVFVVLILVAVLMSRCSSCDPKVQNCTQSSYRSTGGAYGGYTSGGGHK